MAAEDYFDFSHMHSDDLWGMECEENGFSSRPKTRAIRTPGYVAFPTKGYGSDRHGHAWEITEDKDLADRFKRGYTIQALAERHGRSAVAITSRLQKLGLADRDGQRIGAPTKFEVAVKGKDMNIHHILTLLQKGYTTVNVAFPENRSTAQTYTYKVSNEIAATLKESDLVLVPVGTDHVFKTANVVVVHSEPQIDVKRPYALKWVVQKVDLTVYNDQLDREKKAVEMIQIAERRTAQQRAMEILLANVDNVEELKQLLNPEKL